MCLLLIFHALQRLETESKQKKYQEGMFSHIGVSDEFVSRFSTVENQPSDGLISVGRIVFVHLTIIYYIVYNN